MGQHTQGPWKWHRRYAADSRNGAIYAEPHEGHVYAVAMQPRYASNEQWADDAELIVRAVNAHDDLVAALEWMLKSCEARGDNKHWDYMRAARSALTLAKHGASTIEEAA